MPEQEKAPSRSNRRARFIVPGEWALHTPRPRRESRRIVKWPTSVPPHRETARPTQSVIGFMRWMRQLLDRIEAQRQHRQNQRLARTVLKRVMRPLITPRSKV